MTLYISLDAKMEKELGLSTDLFLHSSQMPFIKKFFLSELWARQGMVGRQVSS